MNPVVMAGGFHPFPSRTRQLSPHAPRVLGWKRPGRVGRRRFFKEEVSFVKAKETSSLFPGK